MKYRLELGGGMCSKHCFALVFLIFLALTRNLSAQLPTEEITEKPQIRATGFSTNGEYLPLLQVRVEEFLRSRLFMLHNYLYFDADSAALPTQYRVLSPTQTQHFQPENAMLGEAENNRNNIQHHILNILAYRLRQHPKEAITLSGEQRYAEIVKQYLLETWMIASSRIAVQTSAKSPQKTISAPGQYPSVEIRASSLLLQPVILRDTVREAHPPALQFSLTIPNANFYPDWAVKIKQRGKLLRVFEGKGTPPEEIRWSLVREPESVPRDTVPLTYRLELGGGMYGTRVPGKAMSVPVQQITLAKKRWEGFQDSTKNYYFIVGFAPNSAVLNDAQKMVLDMIRSQKLIAPGASVRLEGAISTENESKLDNAQKLSEQRAAAVATALGLLPEQVKIIDRKGTDNAKQRCCSPDAEWFERSVKIEVTREKL